MGFVFERSVARGPHGVLLTEVVRRFSRPLATWLATLCAVGRDLCRVSPRFFPVALTERKAAARGARQRPVLSEGEA